ncbi:IclR family transcriptional regulator C-terminal domain-containing protein [Microbacterium aurantiacum]
MSAAAGPLPGTVGGVRESADFVQSLARGLGVIRAFDRDHPSLRLSDVARRADLTRAAARRFLLTLEELGYVRSDDGVFSLTPRVLELGFSYLSAARLPALVQPHLVDLAERIDESASAAVRDDTDIVYVGRVAPRRIMSVGITVGTRFPAASTSMGRVLLAALDDDAVRAILERSTLEAHTAATLTDPDDLLRAVALVRAQGWALVDGELETGLLSVAAPVHDARGRVIAAVNVALPSARIGADRARSDILPALVETARRIDEDLRLQHPG